MSEESKNNSENKQGLADEQKNRDFVQVYRDHIDDLTRLARDNAKAYDLFMLLCKHMDGLNALCVSNVALQELLDCGRATVCRAIKYLKDNGWICVLKSGTSNVYIANPDVVWTSYDNQKKYCKFQATVLLSSSENNEYLKSRDASTHFKTIDTDFVKKIAEENENYKNKVDDLVAPNEESLVSVEIKDYPSAI